MKRLLKTAIVIVTLAMLQIFVIYFAIIFRYRLHQQGLGTPSAFQLFGFGWSAISIVAILSFVISVLAMCYTYLWYKPRFIPDCTGFMQYCRLVFCLPQGVVNPDESKIDAKAVLAFICCGLYGFIIAIWGYIAATNFTAAFSPAALNFAHLILALSFTFAVIGQFIEWLYNGYKLNKKARDNPAVLERPGFQKKWLVVYVIIAIACSATVYQHGRTTGLAPLQPLWVTGQEFRNLSPTTGETCGTLAHTIWQVHPHVLDITEVYQGARFTLGGFVYPFDPHHSNRFRQYFLQGFYNDNMRHILPFNFQFMQYILQETDTYFALPYQGQRYGGKARVGLNRTNLFVSVSTWPNTFVNMSLHEVGHALGLGESLTGLFAEEFMGIAYSVQEPIWQRSLLETYQTGRWSGGIYYNSTFDRSLLGRLEAENRAADFWYAAFHSNAEYAQLWDRYGGICVL